MTATLSALVGRTACSTAPDRNSTKRPAKGATSTTASTPGSMRCCPLAPRCRASSASLQQSWGWSAVTSQCQASTGLPRVEQCCIHSLRCNAQILRLPRCGMILSGGSQAASSRNSCIVSLRRSATCICIDSKHHEGHSATKPACSLTAMQTSCADCLRQRFQVVQVEAAIPGGHLAPDACPLCIGPLPSDPP